MTTDEWVQAFAQKASRWHHDGVPLDESHWAELFREFNSKVSPSCSKSGSKEQADAVVLDLTMLGDPQYERTPGNPNTLTFYGAGADYLADALRAARKARELREQEEAREALVQDFATHDVLWSVHEDRVVVLRHFAACVRELGNAS